MARPRPDVDAKIERLRAEMDLAGQNLRDLDEYTARRLLADSTLTGVTATTWAQAEVDLATLWRGYLALVDHTTAVTGLRGSHPRPPRADLDRIVAMLDADSVRLAAPPLDPTARSLVGEVIPVRAYRADDLLAEMSATFAAVNGVVSRVDRVWSDLLPRAVAADDALAAAVRQALDDGIRVPNSATTARTHLEAVIAAARTDPLAQDEATVARTVTDAETERAGLLASVAVRRHLDDLVRTVEDGLAEAARALDRAATVEQSVAVKVDMPTPATSTAQVSADLDQARVDLARTVDTAARDWEGTGRRLADLTRRVDAIAVAAARAQGQAAEPLAVRDELRGRLAAFRSMAHTLGLGEDIGLDQCYRAAADELYSAPCHLARAQSLVAEYRGRVEAVREGVGP